MSITDEITSEVIQIFKTNWSRRDGRGVPEADEVKLGNDAVTLAGTVLYADLEDSTGLVARHKDWFAAEVYKAYLRSACRIIRHNGGEITAFDGDRVMAVFIGSSKNTSAATAALQINHIVKEVINPSIRSAYPATGFELRQCVGIDTSELFVARTGIRGSNDLVWVGRAANYAAKLCSRREGAYASYITADVYDTLHDSAKSSDGRSMWEKFIWTAQSVAAYRSNWSWKPT